MIGIYKGTAKVIKLVDGTKLTDVNFVNDSTEFGDGWITVSEKVAKNEFIETAIPISSIVLISELCCDSIEE